MRWLDRVLGFAAGTFVIALLGTVSAGVIFRSLNHPLTWTDEAACFLMVWIACLGWMIGTRRHTHIRIRMIMDKLPRKAWNASEVTFLLCEAFLGGVIAWYSVVLVRMNSDIEATSMPVAVAWMYAPMVLAGLLTMLQALADAGNVLRGNAVVGTSVDLM